MNNYIQLEKDIKQLYGEMKFDEAKKIIDQIIIDDKDGEYGMSLRFLRARGYERGLYSCGINPESAFSDYSFLADRARVAGYFGLVNKARMLIDKDLKNNLGEAVALCEEALAIEPNDRAQMLLGFIHENGTGDFTSAAKWYLRAYRSGMPWGLRYYARLRWKQKRYIRSVLAHLIVTLTAPIMRAIKGHRDPFW